jgi:hypothetical protein
MHELDNLYPGDRIEVLADPYAGWCPKGSRGEIVERCSWNEFQGRGYHVVLDAPREGQRVLLYRTEIKLASSPNP